VKIAAEKPAAADLQRRKLIQGSVGFAERGATTVSNLLPAIWQHAWGGGAGH